MLFCGCGIWYQENCVRDKNGERISFSTLSAQATIDGRQVNQ